MSNCCKKKGCLFASGIGGAILLALGLLLIICFDALYNMIIKNQTAVVPGTAMYRLNWYDVQIPVYRKFYLFNVTNKEEFLAQSSGNYVKPVLQQLGPYVYREFLKKDNVDYLDYNDTVLQQVYFRQTATFFFDPDLSAGKEEDVVNILNIVVTKYILFRLMNRNHQLLYKEQTNFNIVVTILPSLIDTVFADNPVGLNGAYALFNKLVDDTNSELIFTMTVGEFLWGFDDPLFTAILELLFPQSDLGDFGLFKLTNMSIGWRDYQVYTGKGDYRRTNEISMFRNMSELPYWFGETCNDINGTDGTMTAPFMDKTKRTYMFIDEMCRSIYATYESDGSFRDLQGWKYSVPQEIFQSPFNNSENECFCKDLDSLTCQHDGALSVASCYYGVPLIVSFPHFLYEDGFYSSKLVGMEPDKEKHGLFLMYEPMTGIVIDTQSQIQLSILIKPNRKAPILNQIDEQFAFPVIWLSEEASMPEDTAQVLVFLFYGLHDLVLAIEVVLVVVGVALIAWAITIPCYARKQKNKEKEFSAQQHKDKRKVVDRTISTTVLVGNE